MAFAIIPLYLWVMMILLGSVVMETFMIYPNIFYDAPRSLELAMEFLAVRGPSDYFPPLGFLSWVTGVGAVILGWQTKEARFWILGSVLMIVLDGLLSIAFLWPRNTIMFVEGAAVHSDALLIQTAREFEALHWVRLALTFASAILIFVGYLKFYRQGVITQEAHHEPVVAART